MPALKHKIQPEVFPRLLDEKQAARYLNVSPSTMVRWRKRREGPSFFQCGGVIRYAPQALDKFIDKNMHEEEQEQKGNSCRSCNYAAKTRHGKWPHFSDRRR